MIDISHETRDGGLIIRPRKRIDSSAAKSFEEQTSALLGAGALKVVIDLSEIDYISSAGLRVLLTAAKRVKAGGGAFTLCGVRDKVKDVFEVSGFSSFFGMHAGVDEALASLRG